jgi:hypothetical protein
MRQIKKANSSQIRIMREDTVALQTKFGTAYMKGETARFVSGAVGICMIAIALDSLIKALSK